jgi:hypothetical protein
MFPRQGEHCCDPHHRNMLDHDTEFEVQYIPLRNARFAEVARAAKKKINRPFNQFADCHFTLHSSKSPAK